MPGFVRKPYAILAGAFMTLAALGGCTDKEIVFRDRDPFNPPVDSVNGFLGYYTASERQTACGNCHVGHQADWEKTAHSDAVATLVNSGEAQGFCYGCHTVSERGNKTTGPAGYNANPDPAYHDVQCESCHGPGFDHVQNPEDPANWPLPRVDVVAAVDSGCASCHNGVHHPFVEDWSQSRHAQVEAHTIGSASCEPCHNGKGALRAWGVNSNYLERDSAGTFAITCGVCHDPHGAAQDNTGAPFAGQLRYPIDDPTPENNLCVKCHLRRDEPPINSSRLAPHAPQGGVVFGTAGYIPNGFTYDTSAVLTSHASVANPRLCAGCHVNAFDVVDTLTDQFTVRATGHTFRPIPCLDPVTGQPIADNSCGYTETERSWVACTRSGCHASAAIAVQRLQGISSELTLMSDVIWTDLDGDETVDAAPTDGGYLATIRQRSPGEFAVDATITAAEGAEFNVKLVGPGRYSNGDKSLGVHNPFLARALLSANILELEATYPPLPAPPAPVRALISRSVVLKTAMHKGAPSVSSR